MALVYLPEPECLFLWGADALPASLSELAQLAERAPRQEQELVTPGGRGLVPGRALPLLPAAGLLAAIPAATLQELPGSFAAWALASKLALELVAREQVLPTIRRQRGRIEARWAAAFASAEDTARLSALALALPPAAHALPASADGSLEVWAPEALLRAFLDATVDALVREAQGAAAPAPAPAARRPLARPRAPAAPAQASWDQRWRQALQGPERGFAPQGFRERALLDELQRWSAPALGARDRLRACFRLELPASDHAPFLLRFLLQAPDDASLLVTASEVWQSSAGSLARLGRAFREPQESLLEALGRAARLLEPIQRALAQAQPEALELEPAGAWQFLAQGAGLLAEAGFGVIVPAELTASGQRRLRLRMRVGGKTRRVGAVSGAAGLGLEELLAVDWQAVIGDQPLTPAELAALAAQKAPLVWFRGAWVALDPAELPLIQERLARGPTQLALGQAVQAGLAGETREGPLSVMVSATGGFAELLARLGQSGASELPAPAQLQAELRPYQRRGLGWLESLAVLGLGACLADDMGLGKTMQLLAFLLHRQQRAAGDARPALLVAPTSVVGNWEREAQRFAPTLELCAHYGSARASSAAELARPRALVLTSYGVLRRDAELLSSVDWSVVVLDEAQNIKNAASATARAARQLRAAERFALTGTPVENRLAELWTILEFANPGLLGSLEKFRREVAIPVERYGNDAVAARLRRVVSPFVLRRLKSDPAVLQELPPKHEMSVVCSLTREQASLYKAVVDAELRRIAEVEGMERKGRVLALLTATKQICNHPAQYLSERGPLPGRSGKLERLTEMLEEALAAGDKALVFTQFREMGERLVTHLVSRLGVEVLFLHGGTPKAARDQLVQRFQQEPRAARVFVLSLKAGGTGLNLTAASHVFHYDRWWNPAVEDQATDRAYRIGQRRAVQVHKLLSAGTVEEKIAALLERKRKLAARVVGSGERWLTELEPGELEELFALSAGAAVGADELDDGLALDRVRP